MKQTWVLWLAVLVLSMGAAGAADAPPLPEGAPAASIDLMTSAGARAVSGTWRYRDVEIVPVDFVLPGPDGQPTGGPTRTWDISPHAGGVVFYDADWEVIAPESLPTRRGSGRLCFNWYRIKVTVPGSIGGFSTRGATVVFETSVDDYAEVWVDGELPRAVGQSGGSVVKGWNAANRLVVGRDLRPGQQIQLAVFGINAPLSNPVTNYIWMRTARLDFYRDAPAVPLALVPQEVNVLVVRKDPRIDAIVPPNPKIWKLAEGFQFTEGPVWIADAEGGHLLFSDPNRNRIYRYTAGGELSVFREQSGYQGVDVAEYGQPGSNGLTLDRARRLVIAEHGNHRISRLEGDGALTVLADAYRGQRLNSPNDLVFRSDGVLYFTDPPFGLPKFFDDPRKELPFSGVFALWENGVLEVVARDLTGPNGLAFSPDERTLYVANWDTAKKVVMRYPVETSGKLGQGSVFFDMTAAPGEEALDGLKLDQQGNLYVSGPGGLWVIAADGTHLGTILAPRLAANFAWGDEDGKTLYLAARTSLYRMRLNVPGIRPGG